MRRISLILGGLLLAACALYGAMSWRAQQFVRQELAALGYPDIEPVMHVYVDGIVIDRLALNDDTILQGVYLQANPLQILRHDIRSIIVTSADMALPTDLNKPIPFITGIPFTVDTLIAHTVIRGEKIDFKVEMKQNAPTGAVFHFKGKNGHARIKGRGDMYFENGAIQAVNIDFSSIDLSYDELKTKRADGWLSLSYKKEWAINGEIGAGFADINSLQLADAAVTLSGTVQDPAWNLTGKDKKTDQRIAVEQSGKKINLSVQDKNIPYESPEYFDLSLFSSYAEAAAKFKPPPLVEVRKRTAKPTSTVKRKPVPAQTGPVETPQTVVPHKKSFDALVEKSFFKGLRYSNDLTVIAVPCAVTGNDCWIARARSGVISFNDADIPAYFMRMKNYHSATALRQVLQKLDVTHMTLHGHHDQVTQIILNGKADDGRPVHIELSVSDVN